MSDFLGRALTDPGFADDDGTADAALLDVLAEVRAGGRDRFDAYPALAEARLLVPVVAVLGETPAVAPVRGATGEGVPAARPSDKDADMAVMTLVAPDGAKALPAFTSLAAMAAWDERARPVPVSTRRACEAALFEQAEALVIDVAGPASLTVAGAALRALAAGRVPVRPAADDELRAALGAAVRGVAALADLVEHAGLVEADDRPLLGLVARPGAAAAALAAPARQLADAVAADPVARERLDNGLQIAVLPPGTNIPAARRVG